MRPPLAVAAAIVAALPALALGASADDVAAGRLAFERFWVEAPGATPAIDGLGPLFNERACASCHEQGGPARWVLLNSGEAAAVGLVARFGSAYGLPDPTYGRQLQTAAAGGLPAEGVILLQRHIDSPSMLSMAIDLRQGALAPGTRVSYRQAPPLRGRGLIDRVSAAAVMAAADPDDRDGDGISGRVRLLDHNKTIGRFGWKAATRSLDDQIAAAFALDLGLSSPSAPHPFGDCTRLQAACLAAPTGSDRPGEPEITAETVRQVSAFIEAMPVPPPPPADPHAETLFASTGCAACHVPDLPDGNGRPLRVFTDLLLHDMGPDLDDGMAEPGVASHEWRTAPLIGLSEGGQYRRYMHDGRAADLRQAINAHGGEAAAARDRFLALGDKDQDALLRYLQAL